MNRKTLPNRSLPLAAWLLAGSIWLGIPARIEAAAPTVISDPSTNPIASAEDPAVFFFFHAQGMDRTAIDVTWQGPGIDPAKISYLWLPEPVQGFTLPAFSLECTYQGGWPGSVLVTWTLNRGSSGVMKSANGEILAEKSGSFTTPAVSVEGEVTVTPSATQLTVGQKLTFQFSVAMDTNVSASTIFDPTDGDWQPQWDSPTALGCTLTGGIPSGETTSASYTLSGLKTAAGVNVDDFSGDITLRPAAGGDAPTLTPPTGLINGKAVFVFNTPMDPSGLDVKWTGVGVDPGKISSAWLIVSVPGVEIPVSTFESSYVGGWPSTVAVTWTLNQGNSGVTKSAAGVPVATVSGTFTTPVNSGDPGPDPGDCQPANEPTASASLSLFKDINYIQTSPADPVFDPTEKAMFSASVFTSSSNAPASVAQSVSLNKPGGGSVPLEKLGIPEIPGFPIPNIPDSFYLSLTPAPEITIPSFNSVEELNAAYPNGEYSMTVGLSGGGTRTVLLPLNPAPEPVVPKIANYSALQGFDPSQSITVQWNAFAGAGPTDLIQLQLRPQGGTGSYTAPNKCANIELLVTDTSHTIPAGTLRAGVTYDLELSFSKMTHLRNADAQGGPAGDHITGYAEFTLFTKTTRTVVGAPTAEVDLRFARVFTELLGGSRVLTMEIAGTLPAGGSFAQVEGSTDLVNWSPTGIVVSQAALDAGGGVLAAQDPTILTGTRPPHKFYRMVIPQ